MRRLGGDQFYFLLLPSFSTRSRGVYRHQTTRHVWLWYRVLELHVDDSSVYTKAFFSRAIEINIGITTILPNIYLKKVDFLRPYEKSRKRVCIRTNLWETN